MTKQHSSLKPCPHLTHLLLACRSQLTCCDSHEHYSSSHGIGSVGASLISPYNTMGACDWNTALVYTGVGGGEAQVSPGIWRIGSATATCVSPPSPLCCSGYCLIVPEECAACSCPLAIQHAQLERLPAMCTR